LNVFFGLFCPLLMQRFKFVVSFSNFLPVMFILRGTALNHNEGKGISFPSHHASHCVSAFTSPTAANVCKTLQNNTRSFPSPLRPLVPEMSTH
jgi:hypothetical protein